ncbi:MAG: hypothetical protein ACI8Y4_001643 [Candidatus Poriferisodalaceae bacterium]
MHGRVCVVVRSASLLLVVKRLRWMAFGGAFGLVSSMWAQRKAKGLADRYAPVRGTATVAGTARRLTSDLRGAWADGRQQMRSTEDRLRREQANSSNWS